MLEASGNLPAELIRLEQKIKEAKDEQEYYQQRINFFNEDLQRTSQEQDEGKNEMYQSCPRGMYIVHTESIATKNTDI